MEGKEIRMRITIRYLVANIRSFIGLWIDETRCQAVKPKHGK